MARVTITPDTIRSIVKWELQRAPSGLFAAIHGKNRVARDEALSALAERVGKRLEVYTITRENQVSDAAHLALRPDYSDWRKGASS